MKKILIILFFLTMSITAISQIDYYENPDTSKTMSDRSSDNVYRPLYGGDFSLMFGTITYVSVSPKVVFPIKKFAAAGVGGDYIFSSYRNQKDHIYGGNFFTEFFLWDFIVLHLESQLLNLTDYTQVNPVRTWYLGLYAGGGIMQRLGKKGYISTVLLWNFNYSNLSPYANPTLRISFYF